MQIPRACIDCGTHTAKGRTRCQPCLRKIRRKWDRASSERRRERTAEGAARRLRYAINKHGSADCAACGNTFHAQQIDVDHIIPLGQGGPDSEENIRPLCKGCHSLRPLKTP
jgi:5-methylcytosine-specific restriction endonuclease McrA